MIIQYSKVCDFAIGADGQISQTATWTLRLASASTTPSEFAEYVQEWSGHVGDDFRIPAANEQFYTFDTTWYVSAISTKMTEETVNDITYFSCLVTLTGKERLSPTKLINVNERVNQNEEKVKTAKWLVNGINYENFISNHDIGSSASVWAGEDFFVSNISSEAIGNTGYYVTLEAKLSEERLFNIQRNEKITDLSDPKKPKIEVTFTGKCRVPESRINAFRNVTGEYVAHWAHPTTDPFAKKWAEEIARQCAKEKSKIEDYIVWSISENTISPNDYEVTVVVQKKPEPKEEPKVDVTKKTYDVKLVEYKLTAEQCGWRKSSDPNKSWEKITSWTPAQSCPLTTTNTLPEQFIDVPIKCFMVVETSYLPGPTENDNNKAIGDWSRGTIFTSAGPQGFGNITNWLKINQEKKETIKITGTSNNNGGKSVGEKSYTKVVRYYQAAPGTHSWNQNYFSTIG